MTPFEEGYSASCTFRVRVALQADKLLASFCSRLASKAESITAAVLAEGSGKPRTNLTSCGEASAEPIQGSNARREIPSWDDSCGSPMDVTVEHVRSHQGDENNVPPPEDMRSEPVAIPTQQTAGQSSRTKDTVASYMTSNPLCLDKGTTLLDAVKALLEHNISGAPVVEKWEGDAEGCGRLVGVFSEEDVLWKEVEASDESISDTFREPYLWSLMAADNVMMEAVENQALKVLSNTVGLSMSELSISVSPETPMSEAASIMLDAKVKRLPVVSPRPEGKPGVTVVGILSRRDVLKHVMKVLQEDHRRAAGGEGGGVAGAQEEEAKEAAA